MTDTMRWVGSRFTDAVDVEHTVIASSGDLAYTVGFERSHLSVDGGPPRDMVIRVTHIYRRIDGEWKLVHRHSDFPLSPGFAPGGLADRRAADPANRSPGGSGSSRPAAAGRSHRGC